MPDLINQLAKKKNIFTQQLRPGLTTWLCPQGTQVTLSCEVNMTSRLAGSPEVLHHRLTSSLVGRPHTEVLGAALSGEWWWGRMHCAIYVTDSGIVTSVGASPSGYVTWDLVPAVHVTFAFLRKKIVSAVRNW